MPIALDHVFICVENPRAAEGALAGFGLQFGRRVIHQGQGTANACAFFDNAYLELLWRHNDKNLQSEFVRPLGLWERLHWRETGASPFGFAFRNDNGVVPVQTWPYHAPYLPSGATIPIVTPRFRWEEPLVFLSQYKSEARHEHRGKHRRLTKVTVCGSDALRCSAGLRLLCDLNLVALKPAAEHYVELEWDGATCNEFHDFRPTVPLVLRW